MKRKLGMILLIFVASLLVVTAHDEGTSYQPEPTQPITDDAGAQILTNTADISNSDVVASSNFSLDFGSRTLIILLISGVLAVGVTGLIWSITGRNLSNSIIIASFLTIFTGGIHLAFGIRGDWLLLANGVGFLGFGVIRTLNVIRISKFNKLIIVALMGYTVVTFFGYFLTHDHFDTIGLASKLTETILLVILLRELIIPDSVEDSVINASTSPAVN